MKYSHEDIVRQYEESLQNKEKYWEEVAERLSWNKRWTAVLENDGTTFPKWFPGAEFNMCYNCLDRHVNSGHGERTAYIFDSPVTGTYKIYSYAEALNEVSLLAGVLKSFGVKRGDMVMISMPFIPEGVFSMLACARIGALHASITSGMGDHDIAQRIDHCKPKLVLLSSHGHHGNSWLNYKKEFDAACEKSKCKPQKIMVLQKENQERVSFEEGRDVDWKDEMRKASPVGCTFVDANEPLFMIYTSGSTGEPKAVVHSGGMYALRWSHDAQYVMGDPTDHEVYFPIVNLGWIGGAMMPAYGCPLAGVATVIYEGESLLTNDPRALYRTLSKNKVTRAFVRPGIWKDLKGKDFDGRIAAEFNFDSLYSLLVGGERTDTATTEWIANTMKANVWNAYAQTETGFLIFGAPDSTLGKETAKVFDSGVIFPGNIVKIVNDSGEEVPPLKTGKLLLKQGVGPTSFVTLLHDHDLYLQKYFSKYPGYMDTMDEGYMDDKGHFRAVGRTDDMIKVGFYYVTSQALEEIIMGHKSVSQCVVSSATDLVWKEIPVTIYVKKPDSTQTSEEIEKEVQDAVHRVHGETFKLGRLVQVQALPVTKSGKTHRPSCRALTRGMELPAAGILENPEVLPALAAALLEAGYGKNILDDRT